MCTKKERREQPDRELLQKTLLEMFADTAKHDAPTTKIIPITTNDNGGYTTLEVNIKHLLDVACGMDDVGVALPLTCAHHFV